MLPKLKTIIYACDLEGQTQSGLELVLSLANAHQAKVILMHAIEPFSEQTTGMIGTYMTTDAIQSMRKEAKVELQSRLDKVLADMMESYSEELSTLETPPRTMIVNGLATESIQHLAKEEKADLIVMNSRTHTRLEQLFLGSTANKIIHTSSIPVLVIPIK